MTQRWPPERYSQPRSYETNEKHVLLTAAILVVVALLISGPYLSTIGEVTVQWSQTVGSYIGLPVDSLSFIPVVLALFFVWLITTVAAMIAVHESIHYLFSKLCGLSPRFQWTHALFLPNPSVVSYDKGVTRTENITTLGSPLVVLSTLSFVVMLNTTGAVAGTATLIFCVNTSVSCGDLYHVLRIIKLPRGTLFANFDQKDGVHTEYAVLSE